MNRKRLIDEGVAPKDKCTGCSACFNICPVGAISMIEELDGFSYPRIDQKKCINCGMCREVCPVLNSFKNEKNFILPKIYAGWNNDAVTRGKSSSGGIFTLLAENIFKKDGYVCGAAFNDKNEVEHIIISNAKDLSRLRGSKYVQSQIGDNHKKIKELLDANNWVLFSGTPCQVAGLKNFLKKEYSKLLLVDNVCHGVPSPGVYKKYLEEIELKNGKKIRKVKFRDKSKGWKDPQFILAPDKGPSFVNKSLFNDVFGRGFLTNLILRNSCTSCEYLQWPKASDLTLGDFWGIGKYDAALDDDKGTSMIMVNSEKGNSFIRDIKNKVAHFREIDPEVAINNNYPVLVSSDQHVNRKDFFEELSRGDDKPGRLILKYLDDNNWGINKPENSVGILNFYYENFNFGANLIAYSMQTLIKRIGYRVKIINYNPFPEQSVMDKVSSLNFYKFRQEFLDMTKECRTEEDLIKLNNQFDFFVVGSDQVWRKTITGDNLRHYFLDFALSSKKRISYASSFGSNKWEGNETETVAVKKLLTKFAAISVREKSAIKILAEKFGVHNAASVLDPTLLLGEEDYEELTNSSDYKDAEKDFLAFYFIFDKDRKIEQGKKMQEIKNWTGLEVVNIKGQEELVAGAKRFVYNSIPNFLNRIKNSKFVITDSYHGVLFSIIYKKDFVCIGRKSKSLSRFIDIFSILNLDEEERLLSSLEEVSRDIFLKKINYKNVYKKLEVEKKKSLNYLIKSLKAVNKDKDSVGALESELMASKIECLTEKNLAQAFKDENTALKQTVLTLQEERGGLINEKESLLNRKSIRYADKLGRALRRAGIKK